MGWKLNYNNDKLIEILNCLTDLEELGLRRSLMFSDSFFNWIRNNWKFEVLEMYRLKTNVFQILGELKQLRHIRTDGENNFFANGLQFKSDSLQKFEMFHLYHFL